MQPAGKNPARSREDSSPKFHARQTAALRGGGARITEKLENAQPFGLAQQTYSDEQKGPVSRVLIFAEDRGRAIQREGDNA
jgi:hypothetical protein